MPSWFKKVFQGGAAAPTSIRTEAPEESAVAESTDVATAEPVEEALPPESAPKIRNIVNAPLRVAEDEISSWSEDVKIKARVEQDQLTCTFMIDRPILEGLSAWFPAEKWSDEISGLAAKLFTIEGVGTVLLHDMTIAIGLSEGNTRPWEDLAAEVGSTIRDYLKSGELVVTDAFRKHVPPEDEIKKLIQECVSMEINPGIASHGGFVTIERIQGNTIFITMGGGCQGCAASAITLRQGIHTAFRQAVPQIGAIYDETDHTAGTNPYFNEIPAGMS